ncbi:MAG: bifunctional 5,10-methylene-tetrahydrofolate dehydrogenase/5,10-methylene-tetrahydrofolate cyclohydrolase [Candidatus Muiribacterium halophilum]|uniref:Bifunctional protein FolD n=1 Tax=Muiribacterium halophilum TaxID=2053465 RepID=A0A2N5ZGF2_MUIH1|nr:MAG: bifunctional 5,10-methylene-tetrahydrofolate dehydrogenase/5,10-methylene-tetrahydrofolate cyclohydrolase [Candidatus Muirbacterium halophilum]
MKILNGKELARKMRKELKEKISKSPEKPGLAVVLVGEDPSSKLYVNMKERDCKKIGITSKKIKLEENTTQERLLDIIRQLNEDDTIHGILVQLPLPSHIDESVVIDTISSKKDVDGFHPMNLGKMLQGRDCFLPATPAGIIDLLKENNIMIEGKEVAVVGRSNIVGKPVASLLTAENGTVTVCHSRTKNIETILKRSDIIIMAIGRPNFLKGNMIKENVVIVDVGTTYIDDKLYGDVDFESVKEKASWISPVPGGVGPMTRAALLKNTYKAFLKRENR